MIPAVTAAMALPDSTQWTGLSADWHVIGYQSGFCSLAGGNGRGAIRWRVPLVTVPLARLDLPRALSNPDFSADLLLNVHAGANWSFEMDAEAGYPGFTYDLGIVERRGGALMMLDTRFLTPAFFEPCHSLSVVGDRWPQVFEGHTRATKSLLAQVVQEWYFYLSGRLAPLPMVMALSRCVSKDRYCGETAVLEEYFAPYPIPEVEPEPRPAVGEPQDSPHPGGQGGGEAGDAGREPKEAP